MSYGQPPAGVPLTNPSPALSPSLPSTNPFASVSSPSPAAALASIPLSPTEVVLRNHAILCSIAWLILLPLGALVARYLRTFTRLWFWVHAVIQLLFSAPIFYAGWQRGAKIARLQFVDTHERVGLAMLILFTIQLVLGIFIHYVKFPVRWPGGRSPQNYLHVAIGIALLALGSFNVHQGIYYEWPRATGNRHPIPQSAKNAWLALVIIFWALYGLGFGFLPRQFKQEKAAREQVHKELRVSSA